MRAIGFKVAMILAVATPVAAQTVADDARCLLVSSTYARTARDPKAQGVAQAASAFFLGSVDGRYPPAALKAALAAEMKTVGPANAAGIMNTCAARVAQAETRIQAAAPAPAKSPAPLPVPTRPSSPVGR